MYNSGEVDGIDFFYSGILDNSTITGLFAQEVKGATVLVESMSLNLTLSPLLGLIASL